MGQVNMIEDLFRDTLRCQSRAASATEAIFYNVCRQPSRQLEHITGFISSLRGRFKVGITSDARARWFNPRYGYAYQGWRRMQVLASGSPQEMAMLEIAVVASVCGNSMCDNRSAGGESAPVHMRHCQLYVVS